MFRMIESRGFFFNVFSGNEMMKWIQGAQIFEHYIYFLDFSQRNVYFIAPLLIYIECPPLAEIEAKHLRESWPHAAIMRFASVLLPSFVTM